MKYNGNINYIKCLEFGLNLSQWAVMDLMTHLSTWAEWKDIDGEIYYYLSTQKMTQELPLISENKNTFLKILKNLKEKELIEHKIYWNKWYYKLSEKWKTFVSKIFSADIQGVEKNPYKCGKKSTLGVENFPHNNNTSNNNTNINNNSKELLQQNAESEKNFWDENINMLLSFLYQTIGIDQFKESQKLERMYARHLINWIKKHGKEQFVSRAGQILSDDFKSKNCNSIKYFYNELKSFIHTPGITKKPRNNNNVTFW